MKANSLFALLVFMAVAFLGSCRKDEVSSADEKYFSKVRTIVENNCTISCHAPSKGFHEGMPVVLETDDDIERNASNIKASVADPVTYLNKRMPQGGMLSDADIEVIVSWWEKGGKKTD